LVSHEQLPPQKSFDFTGNC